MRIFIIMLGFFLLLPGAALAENVSSWGYMKKDGTYMEPQRRSLPMVPFRNDDTPTQRDAKPQTGRQEKKRIDPYDPKYNGNYRPKY